MVTGLRSWWAFLWLPFLVNVTEQAVPESDSDLERAVEGSVWSVLKSRPYLIVFTLLCGMLWFALNQMTMASPLYLSHLFGQEGPVRFGQLMTYACVLVVIITPLLLRATSGNTETMALAYAGLLFVLGYGLVMLAPTIPVHFFSVVFSFRWRGVSPHQRGRVSCQQLTGESSRSYSRGTDHVA